MLRDGAVGYLPAAPFPFSRVPVTLPPSIALLRLYADAAARGAAASVLSAEEVERLASFRHDDRRATFAVGRLAARTLIAERAGCSAADVVVSVLDDGSLSVPDTGLHLSISHSGLDVVAVIGDHAVAVDLERIKPRPASLYRFMLRPDESGLLDTVPGPDDRRIALLWSIKESVLKGRRTGLRHSPKSLHIVRFDHAGRAEVLADDGARWQVALEVADECALAVAWPA